MKTKLMFLALAAVVFASCNREKKGEGGTVSYKIYTSNNGTKITEGDFVCMNVVIKNAADSIVSSTYKSGLPQPMIVPKPQFKGDITDFIKTLTEGDSALVKISADSIFKAGNRPPVFKGAFVTYQIKVEKVIPKGTMTDSVFKTTFNKYLESVLNNIKNQEPKKIQKYIAENNLKPAKTDSGLYYIINKAGTGPLPQKGDTVFVNYTGKLMDGKVFDSNIYEVVKKENKLSPNGKYVPMSVALGAGQVIKGWDQGLTLLNKGAHATLIVPSSLAYGSNGMGPISPYSPLVFDIEVVNIVHPKAKK